MHTPKVVPRSLPDPGPDAAPPSALLRFMQAYVRFSVDDMNALLKEHALSMPQLGALHFLRAEGAQSVSASPGT